MNGRPLEPEMQRLLANPFYAIEIHSSHGRRLTTASGDSADPFQVADPYPAITVHPGLCEAPEPIVDEAVWAGAAIRGLEEGERVWLINLLSVPKGAYGGDEPYGYRRSSGVHD